MSEQYDVIIIGAGPAGLSAGIYTGRAGLNTLLLERGMPGGQILMTDWIENYPGFPDGIAPFPLMEDFRRQSERFGAKILSEEVVSVKKKAADFAVSTREGQYSSRALIIATGTTHRRLGVPGEGKLTGKGVSFCATCDGAFFRDRVVGVVGGGSFALTEALFLTKFAREVKLIHRRRAFRAEKILQERIGRNAKITPVLDSVIEEVKGETQVTTVLLRDVSSGRKEELALDGLFVSIGMIPNTGFIGSLCKLNDAGEIVVKKRMAASRAGVFAAGDVTDACSNQVATAVGSGVEAAIAADEYIQSLE